MTTASDAPANADPLYRASRKSKLVAYLLWFLLAVGHRFYLGRIRTGLVQLALWLVTTPLAIYAQYQLSHGGTVGVSLGQLFSSPLYLTAMPIFVWWVVDAFLIPGWVRAHNDRVRAALKL